MRELIGPGYPCEECGEYYGGHLKNCSIPARRDEQSKKEAINRGERILKAIDERDVLMLGSLLNFERSEN